MAMAATPTRDLDDQDEGPPSYLFHVNSVDLTRRRNKLGLGTYTTTAVEEEDDAESGSVRFSGDPVEVIQVSLPFELEGGERNISAAAAAGTKQGGDMKERTVAAEVGGFVLLPAKRSAAEEGEASKDISTLLESSLSPSKKAKLDS